MDTPRDEKRFKHPRTTYSSDPQLCETCTKEDTGSLRPCNHLVEITMYLTDYEVMQSFAGWYVGQMYWSPEYGGMIGPYDRVSVYLEFEKEAQQYLKGMSECSRSE